MDPLLLRNFMCVENAHLYVLGLMDLSSNQDPADPTTFPNYRGSYHSDPMAVDHRNSYANPALQGSPRTAYTGAAEV